MSYPEVVTVAEVYSRVKYEMRQLIEEAETVDDAKTKVEKAISLIKSFADLRIRSRELDEELLALEDNLKQEEENNGI